MTRWRTILLRFKLVCFISMVMLGLTCGESEESLCKRDLFPKMTGDNGYRVYLVGNPRSYKANEVYTVSIGGTFPNQTFTVFVLNAVPRHARDEDTALGTLQNIDPKKSKSLRLCPHVITESQSHESKDEVEILWTAPPTGSGCVEFRASVGDAGRGWYKDDGALTKILCEEDEESGGATQRTQNDQPRSQTTDECCACGSAKYEMTFEGVWSQESHPRDYPTHKRLLHWSNIVGASHSNKFRIWEYGGYATKGVKEVCEFGYPRAVEEEVKRSSKEARTIIKTTGIWWKDPVGIVQNRSARFTTDRRRHYVSMITMLGPSPDWCVGISARDLCLPNCTWSEGFVVDLLPWDAGTDSGITYMSPNSKTDPQQRIRPITNNWPHDPRSPFFGADPIKPLARLRVEKLSPQEERAEGDCPDDALVDFDFFGEGESAALDAEKKKEQIGGGKCEVLPWEDWSGCSVTCGVGSRMRRRRYKHPEANEGTCGLPIVERENCIGIENECETSDEDCALTSWSDWSPCSVTCGKGATERRRYYLIDGDENRCNRTVQQVEECTAEQVDCNPIRKSHEICSLPSLRGPCRGSFQKWYYDRRSKKCLSFQYGGCRGNGNRFETKDECLASCAEDDETTDANNDYCNELSDPGTCGKRIEMWYFDGGMQKCLPFEYSGCGGNKNRFKTMDECTEACQSVRVIDTGNRCSLPAVPGPCRDTEERWYFDTQMQKCLPFDYGGCHGNENNFRTMDECTEQCQLSGVGISLGGDLASGSRCFLPSERGPCRDNQERWYFDGQMQKCLPFDWSGCGGNTNNFNTMDECTEICQLNAGGTNGEGNDGATIVLPSARCGLLADAGPCRAKIERWYFDLQMQKCLMFDYGGCGGNANNFQSMDECTDSCQPRFANKESSETTTNKCYQPSDPGPCSDSEERWYFDLQMEKCLPFHYGGCLGNENNFHTMDECTDACRSSANGEVNRCSVPSDQGPCFGNLERWYFDVQMEKCIPFRYGGCAGNGNNFETADECTESCQVRDRVPQSKGDDRCTLPSERGPCGDDQERWYFDTQMQKCLPFGYGGCLGNENNFLTMDKCTASCQFFGGDGGKTPSLDSVTESRCSLQSERGPCSDNRERWYFDTQMEKCLPFDYSGCGGNDNNFRTMEECAEICSGGSVVGGESPRVDSNSNRCAKPSEQGPCRNYEERWYFDTQMEKCLPFHYGGCQGNENNFHTMDECSEACRAYGTDNATNFPTTPAAESYGGRFKRYCTFARDRGLCRENLERWYFDINVLRCQPFQYGGCGGNANNFQTEGECMETCKDSHEDPNQLLSGSRSSLSSSSSPSFSSSLSSAFTSSSSTSSENGSVQRFLFHPQINHNNIHASNFLNDLSRCNLAPDPGPCKAKVQRWYFDQNSNKCLPFDYGGCSGNANNFQDMYTCMGACHLLDQRSRSSVSIEGDRGDRCELPPDTGPCRSNLERWYFDKQSKNCLRFQYGGCGGNENNFHDHTACAEACRISGANSAPPPDSDKNTNQSGGKCRQPFDIGPCRKRVEKWYYDSQMEKCFPFQYGGCGGNDNRFDDMYACIDECLLGVTPTEPSTNRSDDRCFLPPDMGPCKARIERWYYNSKLKSCLTFLYGGCGGNGNSFQSHSACSDACRRASATDSNAGRPLTSSATESLAVDCRMSSWSNWSACSATCGSGQRTKTREILIHPTHGGKQCSKMVARRQKCKLPACANECQYGQWSSWSSCTKSCGYGSYRQRKQIPISSSSSSSSSGGNLKCAERVQRALCELPKCPH